jgi:Astacin (Peptidase family M12A)/Ricin-type beta-trefoil lectin domain-like
MTQRESILGEDARDGFIELSSGIRPIRYSVANGLAIFEGDIVLGTAEEMEKRSIDLSKRDVRAEAIAITGQKFRWPGGVVPFTIDAQLPDQLRVTRAIAHWQSETSLRFVPRINETNFITFSVGDGCSSSAGMQGGRQFIRLSSACTAGNTIHEIGHAIGLWHEQSREDRDSFVRINLENVLSDKQHNFDQHITDGDDIGAYDYGSIMHYDEFAFSSNGRPTIDPIDANAVIGQRNNLSAGDLLAVRTLYPTVPGQLSAGIYKIRQKSNGRFVDAHESSDKDFRLVTRSSQNNDSQRWLVSPLGGVFTIQQLSNRRFVDAHEHSGLDFGLVTRTAQNNDTQKWVAIHQGYLERGNLFTLRQLSSRRLMDAHQDGGHDFAVVTRDSSGSENQKWIVIPWAGNQFLLQQKSTGRFLDAHEIAEKDFALVTRPEQNNETQVWIMTPIGIVCSISQRINARSMDAYRNGHDFASVTRPGSTNENQRWVVMPSAGGGHTIRQLSSGRFLDAHETADRDFSIVTRPVQGNDTQVWLFDPAQ